MLASQALFEHADPAMWAEVGVWVRKVNRPLAARADLLGEAQQRLISRDLGSPLLVGPCLCCALPLLIVL